MSERRIFVKNLLAHMVIGHGNDKNLYKDIETDFSSNVPSEYFLDSTLLIEHIRTHLPSLSDYPEADQKTLQRALESRLSLKENTLIVTSGATEAIYLIALAFRNETSAILCPAFREYQDACTIHNHDVRFCYRKEEIPYDSHLIWICNPNNPTGDVIGLEEMRAIIESHKDQIIIIDQSYEALTMEAMMTAGEATSYDNVILIHSMTKEHAIAGLRLGYLTAPLHLAERMRRLMMPWSVNSIALMAGMFLISQEDNLPLGDMIEERDVIMDGLRRTGCFDVWDSKTTFFLARMRMSKAPILKDYLAREHKMLIRDCSNFEGLDDTFIRISPQSPDENDRLLDAVEKFIML